MEIDPNPRKSTLRWLSTLIITASVALFALHLWEFIQHKAHWSKLLFPFGLFLSGLSTFLDPDGGRLQKIGGWIAAAVMFLSIAASFFEN